MRKLTFALLCLFIVCPCQARTITVDDNGPADFSNIQAAIDDADDGDIVIVADGTYDRALISGPLHKNKAITVRSEKGPENCVINGGGEFGFWFYHTENTDCRLEGFTVTNCSWDFGAVYCSEVSSPTISNCIISNNGNPGGSPHYRGIAGIRCDTGSSPTISNCLIVDNYGCAGNTFHGSGILCDYSCHPVITNCTIVNNTGGNKGGGIYCMHFSSITVTNCIIWANSPSQIIIEGNSSASVTYSDVQGGWDGEGNVDTVPMFVNAAGGDYHLLPDSLCIDAGDPNYIAGPNETDLDGRPRVIGGRIDMGAYEFFPPVECLLHIFPSVMVRDGPLQEIMALLLLPEHVSKEQVDSNEALLFYPGEIPADTQYVLQWPPWRPERTIVLAFFDKIQLMNAVSDNGRVELEVVGKMKTGQKYVGQSTIWIIDKEFRCIVGFALHWLDSDCTEPYWCDGFDIDRDSVVNFADFALCDGCNTEVDE